MGSPSRQLIFALSLVTLSMALRSVEMHESQNGYNASVNASNGGPMKDAGGGGGGGGGGVSGGNCKGWWTSWGWGTGWGWGSGGNGSGGGGGGAWNGGGVNRGNFSVGEYAQCRNQGSCKRRKLICPLHCHGPCVYDCDKKCVALCK
ncbi:uncharacterized protein LOC144710296 [Wolffia australiana]